MPRPRSASWSHECAPSASMPSTGRFRCSSSSTRYTRNAAPTSCRSSKCCSSCGTFRPSRDHGELRLETLDIPTGANAAEMECDVIDDGATLSVRCEFSSVFDGRHDRAPARSVPRCCSDGQWSRPTPPLPGSTLLAPDERALLDSFGRGPTCAPEMRRADQMLAARASEAPGAIALVAGDEQVTYGELDRWVNRIARHLHSEGVTPGAVVGLCLRREAVMVPPCTPYGAPAAPWCRSTRHGLRPAYAWWSRTPNSTPSSCRRSTRIACPRFRTRWSLTTLS